jgi:hypothetical protein
LWLLPAACLFAADTGQPDFSVMDEAMVLVEPSGFYVVAPPAANLIVMNVRVYSADSKLVLSQRSRGEAVELSSAGLTDGVYRYEIRTILETDGPITDEQLAAGLESDGTEIMSRQNGQFTVKENRIEQLNWRPLREEAGRHSTIMDWTLSLATRLIDFLVADASAQDGVFNNVHLVGSNPELIFDDHVAFDSSREFVIRVQATGDESAGAWILLDEIGVASDEVQVIRIDTVAASALLNSIVVGNNGDLSFAGQNIWIDRSAASLGIGTSSPSGDLSIASLLPDIVFTDETDNAQAKIEMNSQSFGFYVRPHKVLGWQKAFIINNDAPVNSLVIDSDSVDIDNTNIKTSAVIGSDVDTSSTMLTIGNSGSSRAQMEFVDDTGNAFIEWGQGTNTLQLEDSNGDAVAQFNMGAPTWSLYMDGSGNLGAGTPFPEDRLHILNGDLRVEQTAAAAKINFIAGANSWEIKQNANTGRLTFFSPGGGASTAALKFDRQAQENLLRIGVAAADVVDISGSLDVAVNVDIGGNLVVTGDCTEADGPCAPDYVFEPEYELLSLDEVDAYIQQNGHLPNVPNAATLEGRGINIRDMSYKLLEKVEELTLYAIEHQETIQAQQAVIEQLQSEIALLREDREGESG